MGISQLDKNFVQYSVNDVPFCLYEVPDWMLEGFPWEKENKKKFCRLPERILPELTDREELITLSKMAAGGVLRFCTDSQAIMLKVIYQNCWLMPHMPSTGRAGFDIVLVENGRERLLCNVKPDPYEVAKGKLDFDFSCTLPQGMHEYKVYFPLYTGVDSLQLGFSQDARVEKPSVHKTKKPILFYGSSITQGGCASRPSNCHCALVAKEIDAEQINLGFSGNAQGELCIAKEIAKLSLSCLVMDYDYNAPTEEHLQKTHEPFFKAVREMQPDLPVVFISRPYANVNEFTTTLYRRNIILSTYLHALENGDRHVYFIDGMRFFDEIDREHATVDLCHPNDLGFYFMAKHITPVVKEALNLKI